MSQPHTAAPAAHAEPRPPAPPSPRLPPGHGHAARRTWGRGSRQRTRGTRVEAGPHHAQTTEHGTPDEKKAQSKQKSLNTLNRPSYLPVFCTCFSTMIWHSWFSLWSGDFSAWPRYARVKSNGINRVVTLTFSWHIFLLYLQCTNKKV